MVVTTRQLGPWLKARADGVNRLLSRIGIRVAPANVPPRSFAAFFAHVKRLGFDPSFIVDVGVANGTPELYAAFPRAKYLLVEPLQEFEPRLKRLADRLDAEYVLAAADETAGEIEINAHDDLAGSSLLREVEGAAADGRPRAVRTVRLDDLIPPEIDGDILLKIDVQGAELRALKGAEARLPSISMVIAETPLINSMEGGFELAELVDFMTRRGFCVFDVIGGHFRPLDGNLQQVDLVFVPAQSRLRADKRYAAPGQRRALNDKGRQRWRNLAG